MAEWIACADRLPEVKPDAVAPSWLHSEPVLAFLCGSAQVAYCSGTLWYCGEETYALDEVTHWMPLPEDP